MRRLRVSGGSARQTHPPRRHIPAHRHLSPYATLVLDGGYCEAGESGRWHVEPGMLIVHAAGESHADWFGGRATRLIDFPVAHDVSAGVYWAKGDRPDAAFDNLQPVPDESDWPDLLAAAIRKNSRLQLGDWAEAQGIRQETVSRGFLRAYGVSPAAYRIGVRVKAVIGALGEGRSGLADLAAEHGFFDQPHMNRAIRAATGHTPGELRQVKFVQDGDAATS